MQPRPTRRTPVTTVQRGANRKIIVQIATSADGYIAGPDEDLAWLTERPMPKDMYGMDKFVRSVDTKLLGRKTFEFSVRMGAKPDSRYRTFVFSRNPPDSAPTGFEFVRESITAFADELRQQPGKDIWLMGGGELIASFLDAEAIDEFVIAIMPVFIGAGVPLMAPRHRHVPLRLLSARSYPDGVLRLHYRVERTNRSRDLSGPRRKSRSASSAS